jgi:predicted TIM-barrel fold metal-dependent hydrolase
MIIDAQVHLWTDETPNRPWPPGGRERVHLPTALTYDKMLRMMDEARVDRVVIVPPSWEGDRNDYALKAARRHPDRFAVMGRLPLDDPEAPQMLTRWLDQPGMLGIRLTFTEAQANWLDDGTADWFWPAAAEAGVPVMAHVCDHMNQMAGIVRTYPRLKFIIDHMGMSKRIADENRRVEAVERTKALARFPNVSVKLSSAPSYSHQTYPFADMTPYVWSLFTAYGPRRCFWGTDLTRAPDACTYRQRVTHFTKEMPFFTHTDKEWVMGNALAACLNWR